MGGSGSSLIKAESRRDFGLRISECSANVWKTETENLAVFDVWEIGTLVFGWLIAFRPHVLFVDTLSFPPLFI